MHLDLWLYDYDVRWSNFFPIICLCYGADKVDRTVKIETSTVEIEERGVKLRLTVVDTPGYADAINSTDWSVIFSWKLKLRCVFVVEWFYINVEFYDLLFSQFFIAMWWCFSFKAIVSYVDTQYEKYLQDESGLNRRGIVDTRVHCCFYFINPIGHG